MRLRLSIALQKLATIPLAFFLGNSDLSGAPESDAESVPFRIEPAVEKVPANHLKFYLHFPEPMERGEAFRHLRLVEVDWNGKEIAEVPEPFREIELWDETFTRMTLWFHPGRQKPGVNLNVEIGPILEEGKRYRLEVSREWKTESGGKLQGECAHEFRAGPIDNEQPNPDNWRRGYGIDGEGKGFIFVHTGEILDPESALRRIQVLIEDQPVSFEMRGRQFVFRNPSVGPTPVRVVVDPRIEDLAGNSVSRPFNLNLETDPDFQERTEPIVLEFSKK